jgi:hypothetical protein
MSEKGHIAPQFDGVPEARSAYSGVYDFIKHQDDKIGRFLTAIAFLVAASVSLLTNEHVRAVRFEMAPHVRPPLPAILLTSFLVLALVALLVLFSSLGPNSTHPAGKASLLFFEPIASETEHAWHEHWTGKRSEALEARLYQEYIVHTRQLALNAEFKVQRNNEARFFITLATVAFAAGALLSGVALTRSPVSTASGPAPPARPVVRWQGVPQFLVLALLCLTIVLAGNEMLRLGLVESWTTWNPGGSRLLHWGYSGVTVAGVGWAVADVGLAYGRWRYLGLLLVVVSTMLAVAALLWGFPRHDASQPPDRAALEKLGRAVSVAVCFVASSAAVLLLIRERPDILLSISVIPILGLLTTRLTYPIFSWRSRCSQMRRDNA